MPPAPPPPAPDGSLPGGSSLPDGDVADGPATGGAAVVVAVAGAAHPLAAALVRRLAAPGRADGREPATTVVALDERSPREDLAGARWVRADLRGPSLGRVLRAEGVDVVVDATLLPTTAAPRARGGPPAGLHVVTAAQRTPSVRRVVLVSTTGIYGASPRAPSVRTEDGEPASSARGAERDAVEVEAALRAAARRRPELATVVLRLADVVGPGLRTPLGDWLELPVVPRLWGHDPRLQVLHADDAVEALVLAVTGTVTGAVNVAGDGVVTLSQAAALCGRPATGVPAPLLGSLLGPSVAALAGRPVPAPWGDTGRVLRSGRVVDLQRMHEDLGLRPRWTSRAAVEDLARGRGLVGPLSPEVRAAAAGLVAGAVRGAGGVLARVVGTPRDRSSDGEDPSRPGPEQDPAPGPPAGRPGRPGRTGQAGQAGRPGRAGRAPGPAGGWEA